MAIGKSKISDLNFESFQNSIDKNVETDQASDKFDRQLRAYTEAIVKLDAAMECIDTAKDSFNKTSSTLLKVVNNANIAASNINIGNELSQMKYSYLKPTNEKQKKLSLGISMTCQI